MLCCCDVSQDGFHTSPSTVKFFAFIIWCYNFNVFLTYCHFGWVNKMNSAFHNEPLYTICIIYFLLLNNYKVQSKINNILWELLYMN